MLRAISASVKVVGVGVGFASVGDGLGARVGVELVVVEGEEEQLVRMKTRREIIIV
jgi:hypothetical protein